MRLNFGVIPVTNHQLRPARRIRAAKQINEAKAFVGLAQVGAARRSIGKRRTVLQARCEMLVQMIAPRAFSIVTSSE
jgi:hypothetical protein